MPSKVIFDTLSTSQNLPGTIVFESGLDSSAVTGYIQLPSGDSSVFDEDDVIPLGAIRWNTDKVAVEYYGALGWKALSVEEDWDLLIRSGLSMHFDVEDLDSYPGSGNTWINLSKFFTIGSAVPQGDIAFDAVNRGFLFDATSKYFTINKEFATDAIPNDETGTTYSFWFKADSGTNYGNGAGDKLLFSLWDVNVGVLMKVGVNPSGGIYYDDSTVAETTIGSTNYNDNQWYNLVMTRAYGSGAQTTTFYINGTSIGTVTGTNFLYSSVEYVALGAGYNPGVTPLSPIQVFGGLISFVTCHERPLSQTEITSNFDAIKYRYGY